MSPTLDGLGCKATSIRDQEIIGKISESKGVTDAQVNIFFVNPVQQFAKNWTIDAVKEVLLLVVVFEKSLEIVAFSGKEALVDAVPHPVGKANRGSGKLRPAVFPRHCKTIFTSELVKR